MSIKWLWNNYTKVAFGKNSVSEHLPEFIKPNSKILCTYGGGSIEKNGSKHDVETVLSSLNSTVQWAGGIQANPDVERCVEIIAVVKQFQPDLILAVGGGSVVDATKFIALGAKLEDDIDPWNATIKQENIPSSAVPFGVILTLSATGSEWNNGFVISKRSTAKKLSSGSPSIYPQYSIIDRA
jgi:alcohol dehydrogenase YqhD (iron-dependent ADH family)